MYSLRLPRPRIRKLPVWFAVILSVQVGCAAHLKHPERPLPPHYTAAKVTDNNAPEGTYPALERETVDTLSAALSKDAVAKGKAEGPLQPEKSRQINILALSGGGQYGAFAAGILVGWTATGTRPDFDIVTGVSSGGLLAAIAFVGPKYDSLLERSIYLRRSDIYKVCPLINLIRYQSVASFKPLERLIEQEVNDEFIADLRTAHQMGRRLFVGTENVRTRRLVVWDVGAIACSCRPDAAKLVRKILLATASIPGLAPAVKFDVEVNGVHYVEEHADGGSMAQAFVKLAPESPRPDPAKPGAKWLLGSNLYVIAGGKLYTDPIEGNMGAIRRLGTTVSGTLYALYRADLWRFFANCQASGMNFHHVAIPPETRIEYPSTTLDRDTMRELYVVGYGMAMRGNYWRTTPPGYEPGEEEYPRAGLEFTIMREP
jgi:hypothetical protein